MNLEKSEAQWFISLLQDDEAALEHFFHAHFPYLLGYVCSILNDTAEAEDICNSVFFILWDERHTMESSEHVENFLYLLVRRKAYSYLRKQKTISGGQREWLAVYGNEETDTLDLMDHEMMKARVLQVLYGRAAKLPTACKRVFELYYKDGKKAGDIAEQLDISPQTVYNHLSKAVGILRRTLKEKKLLTHFLLFFCGM